MLPASDVENKVRTVREFRITWKYLWAHLDESIIERIISLHGIHRHAQDRKITYRCSRALIIHG